MSSDRQALLQALSAAVMRYQDATQGYDEAVGALYRLNAAERHCLSFLWPAPQLASAIAREIRLTPASVTALLDRLEQRGYVRRRPDTQDRRKVWIEQTEKTQQMAADVYGPIAAEGAALLETYATEDLALINRFIGEATALQERMTDELAARKVRGEGD